MKNIKLTTEEINRIKNKNKIKNSGGFEGTIYTYPDEGKLVALKLFTTKNIETLKNKEKKIILLHQKTLNNNILKPIKTVSDNDHIIGYTEELILPHQTFEDIKLNVSKRKKISYLRQAKVLIENLHKNEIIHGDINSFNFIISNNIVKVCDIDNGSIAGLPIDVKNYNLGQYFQKTKKIDYNSDIYCFNLLTIALLKNLIDVSSLDYIQQAFPIYPGIRKIYEEMVELNQTYNGEYLIDHIKEKTKIKLI